MIASKLVGLSPLLWINLDASVERRERMQSQLRAYGLDGRRIAAVDGRRPEVLRELLDGDRPAKATGAELGCTLSHLKAIEASCGQYDAEFAIICEDDVDFGPAAYWPFDFADVVAALPDDWDVLQLAVSTAAERLEGRLHRHDPAEYCACAYAIRRRYAERLVRLIVQDGKYKLSNLTLDHRYAHCIDHFLYKHGVTYTMPLLTYEHALASTIQVERLLIYVAECSANAIRTWWKTEGPRMSAGDLLSLDAGA